MSRATVTRPEPGDVGRRRRGPNVGVSISSSRMRPSGAGKNGVPPPRPAGMTNIRISSRSPDRIGG